MGNQANALIIFVKNPIKGKVKTRLAETVGDTKALKIYNHLLSKTEEITRKVECKKFVYYSDKIVNNDIWNANEYEKKVQKGTDLGEKMYHAFEEIFQLGQFKNIVIIGSDCPTLQPTLIQKAFDELKYYSYVIGPAYDGGYYLLGMRQLRIELFEKIIWSGPRVLIDTIARINAMVKTFYQLPPLPDVDTFDDWLIYKQSVVGS